MRHPVLLPFLLPAAFLACGGSPAGSPPTNGLPPPDDGGRHTPDAGASDAATLAHDGDLGDTGTLDANGGETATKPPGIPCDVDAADTCIGPETVACCAGFCTDTALDPQNCGACGNACKSQQFCTGTACDNVELANVCDNPRGTIVLDPFPVDNAAGIAVGNAVASACAMPSFLQSPQGTAGVTDPATGRPLLGSGNTFINGGGGYGNGQRGVAYLDTEGLSPLGVRFVGTAFQVFVRASNANVVSVDQSLLTAHHDFFYVQLAVEPVSGTLCFSTVGILGPGTQAGGYFVSTTLVPNRATYMGSWYVYEWTGGDDAGIPGATDTFTQVASSLTL